MIKEPVARRPARGAILLLCLLLLLALSLLGLAAASDRQLQDHINSNIAAGGEGEANAHLASLWARAWLYGLGGERPPEVCGETCPEGAVILAPGRLPARPEFEGADWWRSQGHWPGRDPATGADHGWSGVGPNAEAYWLIEQLRSESIETSEGDTAVLGWYRILARGANARPGSDWVSETLVARPWGDAAWRDPLPPDPGDEPFCQHVPEPLACGIRAWQDLP